MSASNQVSMLETPDVSSLSRAECAALLAQVKTIEGRLLSRLLAIADESSAAAPAAAKDDSLLSASAVAALLDVSVPYIYRNGRKLGLAVQVSPNKLRYSRTAVQAFIAEKRVPKPLKPHGRKQQKMAQPF
jgi:predicted DNA-binding transcriptional regulator AlpA